MYKNIFSAVFSAILFVASSSFARDLTGYPVELAVNIDESGKMSIRSFPKPNCKTDCSMLPIYVYDGDEPYRSNCYVGCIGVWSPVPVYDNRTYSMSQEWSIITRGDGTRQWAYRGRPVYTHYGDTENHAKGDKAENNKWHRVDLNADGEIVIYATGKFK